MLNFRKRLVSAAAAAVMCLTMAGTSAVSVFAAADTTAYSVTYENDTAARYAEQVAKLVNEQRAANGLKPLKLSNELCASANVRAKEIQSVFSHTRPNGTSCFTVLKENGISYTYAGENIAYGQKTPEAVMNSWMNSSGHRANILNTKVEYIGVGVAYKNGIYYWTQFFASGKGMSGEAAVTAPTDVQPQTPAVIPQTPAVTPQTPAVTPQKPASESEAPQTDCKDGKCVTVKTTYRDLILALLRRLGCKNC